MSLSRTAARNTERTLTNRVLTVPAARPFTDMPLTQTSTCVGRIVRSSFSPNVVERTASDIALCVQSVQICRSACCVK